MTENGRQKTGLDVLEWAKQGEALGAGELLLTSIDQEGTMKGVDLELITQVAAAVSIPVIVSGGIGSKEQLATAIEVSGLGAFAMAKLLHYNYESIIELKAFLLRKGFSVRPYEAIDQENSHHRRLWSGQSTECPPGAAILGGQDCPHSSAR